jgi:hypothetical protein
MEHVYSLYHTSQSNHDMTLIVCLTMLTYCGAPQCIFLTKSTTLRILRSAHDFWLKYHPPCEHWLEAPRLSLIETCHGRNVSKLHMINQGDTKHGSSSSDILWHPYSPLQHTNSLRYHSTFHLPVEDPKAGFLKLLKKLLLIHLQIRLI